MKNEDTKRESPACMRREPTSTFARAMSDVAAGCTDLAIATDHHDYEGVEVIARQAASMWLTGHAAHRRLAPSSDGASSEGLKSLQEGRVTLLDLFAHAKQQIDVPHMHRVLDDLRALLAGADIESAAAVPQRS